MQQDNPELLFLSNPPNFLPDTLNVINPETTPWIGQIKSMVSWPHPVVLPKLSICAIYFPIQIMDLPFNTLYLSLFWMVIFVI